MTRLALTVSNTEDLCLMKCEIHPPMTQEAHKQPQQSFL